MCESISQVGGFTAGGERREGLGYRGADMSGIFISLLRSPLLLSCGRVEAAGGLEHQLKDSARNTHTKRRRGVERGAEGITVFLSLSLSISLSYSVIFSLSLSSSLHILPPPPLCHSRNTYIRALTYFQRKLSNVLASLTSVFVLLRRAV